MAAPLLRIFSDLHYGDRASTLATLAMLRPLFEGADAVLLNGDSLDTRPGPSPEHTARLREDVRAFFTREVPATLLTGNHDPDVTNDHFVDAHPNVLVTHGDALFDDLVPWSRDAPQARRLVAAELAALAPAQQQDLPARLGAFRRAAAQLPQRHQAETRGWKYFLEFMQDTVWPPSRILRVLRAWKDTPARADLFLARHRPLARFLVMGHTHRLGITRTPAGRIVLNTGSFCPPCRAGVAELRPDRLALREVERRRGEFRLGKVIAEFPLAPR